MIQGVPGGVVHELPADLREALTADAAALDAWKDITPLARNEFICWVEDAKRASTRERRIRRTREELEEASVDLAAGRDASIATARVARDRRRGNHEHLTAAFAVRHSIRAGPNERS
jgi:hypothetical protein